MSAPDDGIKHIGHPGCARGTCLCSAFQRDYDADSVLLRIAGRVKAVRDDGLDAAAALEAIRTELRRYDQHRGAQ